ncbi:hypothetical protein NQ315_000375 [Exocentrus adspersus]|uniref:Uncharacterized protein n=1 Tax=Exocentrus adspersus TaxID=1586481 RepID=A0AAV8VLI1_9CUCU|nr:hypothetical protein NQ315_000375 [Exocentrus adspersus]
MQFKKPHIPLVPRTANYSCSLTNRPSRRKTSSTQTDKCLSPFEDWLLSSSKLLKGDIAFDEDTIKVYVMALEYINGFHAHMNGKLNEKFGERGDTKVEGNNVFKLPEVPNYATLFIMLLERTQQESKAVKRKTDFMKKDLDMRYATKQSVIEEYKFLENQNEASQGIKVSEQGVQTTISRVIDDESSPDPLKSSDDSSASYSKKSTFLHSTLSEEVPELDKDNDKEGGFSCGGRGDDNCSTLEESDNVEDKTPGDRNRTDFNSSCKEVVSEDCPVDDKATMMELIRKRVQEEISFFLDRAAPAFRSDHHRPRLMQSHFHVVNIPPQINLLEYAQKKLERQLAESRPVSPVVNVQSLPHHRQFLSNCISVRRSMNITPNTPHKVNDMFRKFSQENFRNAEAVLGLECDCRESDEDSVILDDEEFEKINGRVDEHSEKKQKRISSAGKEKSNPLKLTVRDMTKVNEKMLSTIGLFTERGDVRPGVIDILEEQKRAKAKDSRNKQFRSRRQWDLQIHLNPKENLNPSFTSVSSGDKSFISVSSIDLRSEYATVKGVSPVKQVDYDQ